MHRPLDTTKDSRFAMIVNGASVALAVVAVGVWLVLFPGLPDLVKLGVGLAVAFVTLAFLALAIHRSTLKTAPRHFLTTV